MNTSTLNKLRQLGLILLLGIASVGMLLFALSRAADLAFFTVVAGLALAGGFTLLLLRERTALSWQRVLITTAALGLLAVWVLPFAYGPVETPLARAQANITVTTTADVVDANGGDCSGITFSTGITTTDLPGDDGVVSLREAICAANNTAGTDQINLAALTYNLTITNTGIITENENATGDLDIAESVNISGINALTTIIDAGGAGGLGDRVFHVLLGTNVQISDLTIRGGFAPTAIDSSDGGGGIRNFGTLRLDNIVIRENGSVQSGGGIMNRRTLIMTDTVIISNTATSEGGGLSNRGGAASTTMRRVAIAGNNAGNDGGGIWNDNQLTLNEVMISNNNGEFGGGIYNETGTVTLNQVTINNNVSDGGSGGGIRNEQAGVVRGTNVTISGNNATNLSGFGGGIRNTNANSTVVLTNTTIAANVASSANGIQNSASMTLINTIVSNGSSNCINTGGILTDGGNNLESANTCGFTDPDSMTNANPLLGPLQNNGGNTATHALLLGSPAVDGGDTTACPATDQRGQTRVNQPGVGSDTGTPCDIGAYEFTAVVSVPALSIEDYSLNEGDAGTSTAVFTVTLDSTNAATVTVDYATANGSATAGSDYVATNGTLIFPPNAVGPQFINVTVNGDTTAEPHETFTVDLSNPSWATIPGSNQGQGTILNDDEPVVSLNDTTVLEGDSGTTAITLTVSLSSVPTSQATVKYATSDGSAQVGLDYVAASGMLTFPIGVDTQEITVEVIGDTEEEGEENFSIILSDATGAIILADQAVITITDDDGVFAPDTFIYLPFVIKQ